MAGKEHRDARSPDHRAAPALTGAADVGRRPAGGPKWSLARAAYDAAPAGHDPAWVPTRRTSAAGAVRSDGDQGTAPAGAVPPSVMQRNSRPLVVAFDGSPEARAAVRAATELMPGRRLLVTTVWEPSLIAPPQSLGMPYAHPDSEAIEAFDRPEHDHAGTTAEVGARLARDLCAEAEAVVLSDDAGVAEVIMGLAERHDAAAIVAGRRGLGAIRSTVFGSTSRGLLETTRRPVLVVHADAGESLSEPERGTPHASELRNEV